jgi:hypothetical protein
MTHHCRVRLRLLFGRLLFGGLNSNRRWALREELKSGGTLNNHVSKSFGGLRADLLKGWQWRAMGKR